MLPHEDDNGEEEAAVTSASTTTPTSGSSSGAMPAYVARKLAAAPSGRSTTEKGVDKSASRKNDDVKDPTSTEDTTIINESRYNNCRD